MLPFSHNKKLTVINLFAGPGAGKSVTALFLTAHLQAMGKKVEYVHEFAKTQVWDKRMTDTGGIFTEQDYIGAHQHNLIRRLVEHDIEYVVTDTSLLLGLAYMPEWYPPTYSAFLLEVFNSYNNINYFIDRGNIPYVETGRNQTHQQALDKDDEVRRLLKDNGVEYTMVIQDTSRSPDSLALMLKDDILSNYTR